MIKDEWKDAATSESGITQPGKAAISSYINSVTDKSYCSRCATMGILPFCELCGYRLLLSNDYKIAGLGA